MFFSIFDYRSILRTKKAISYLFELLNKFLKLLSHLVSYFL